MPDLQQFSVSRGSPGNLNTPRHVIAGRLQEGSTVIADFTGENALRWPDILATLTPEQQDEIVGDVATKLINMRAGG